MMQTKTTVARKMTIPAAKVWDAIARFGWLDAWFPTISTCVVEGSGVGAVRRMDSTRGGKIVDHIVDIQPEKMRLIYEGGTIAVRCDFLQGNRRGFRILRRYWCCRLDHRL